MKKKGKVIPIQGTNDFSTVSKSSMVKAGYFSDEFISFFVDKCHRRSPLINRGYYIRAKIIDNVFKNFFDFLSLRNYSTFQIISLGAGFDSSYFKYQSANQLPHDCRFVEIDFPEVVERKLKTISYFEELKKLAFLDCQQKDQNSEESKYNLLGIDLNNIKVLDEKLKSIDINYEAPTLFLSECSITYMSPKSSSSMIKWFGENFKNAIFINYEQINPNDGFGIFMRHHFESIGSPLLSLETYPTLSLQKKRYLDLQWEQCEVFPVCQLAEDILQKEHSLIKSLEPFDEFEEFHLKCNHYVLACATNGILMDIYKFLDSDHFKPENKFESFQYSRNLQWSIWKREESLKRFSHSSIKVGKELLFSFGGFGLKNKSHTRLESIILTNMKTKSSLELNFGTSYPKKNQIGHQLTLLSTGDVLIFGGRSSPVEASDEIWLISLFCTICSANYNSSDCAHYFEEDDCKITVNCQSVNTVGPKPCCRWRHTQTVISMNSVDHLFVFGGRSYVEEPINDCFLLNLNTCTWNKVITDVSVPARFSHSATNWHNAVIISCGLGTNCSPLNCVYLFDPLKNNFTQLEISGLLPRYSHTSHIINDHLFLIGGVNNLCSWEPGIALINLKTMECQEIKLPFEDPEYPVMLHKHTSVVTEDEKEIILIGGGGNCFSFGTHINSALLSISVQDIF